MRSTTHTSHRPHQHNHRLSSGVASARPHHSAAGFSLVEVLLASGLSMLLVVATYAMFDQNKVTSLKNNWRFVLEDSARFALDTINEKISLAGHTNCAEIQSYRGRFGSGLLYPGGFGLLYQNTNATYNFTQIQAFNGDATGAGAATTRTNWFPNPITNIPNVALTQDINPDMDALLIRGLGKHVYRLTPASGGIPAGGNDCLSGTNRCNFTLMIGNPLLDPGLSFNNDPMFYELSYESDLVTSASPQANAQFFPIAITNCASGHSISNAEYIPTTLNVTNPGTLAIQITRQSWWPTIPAGDAPQFFAQAANMDLVYVSNEGVLSYTRPGLMIGSSPPAVGVNLVATTPEPNNPPLRGDLIVTGFRALYGTTTAAGLPNGFFRPQNVISWDQVRMVRYAVAFEIIDYHPNVRNRDATNLLDQVIAADQSRNLRRIYEQLVFINN